MTAPTSDERREVAERLRALAHDNQGLLGAWQMRRVMDEGTRILGTVGLPDCAHVLERYADLIDPTCEMDDAGDVPASVKDNLNTFFCSECGAPIYNDMTPSYCPYCGCRVTVVR